MAKKEIPVSATEDIDLGITETGETRRPQKNEAKTIDMSGVATAQPVARSGGPIANLVTVASHFNVTTDDLGDLARIGAESINRAMFEIARAGMAFLRAQELLSLGNFGSESPVSDRSETGGFVAWINEHGLAPQRVYEAMRIAKFVAQLPQDQLQDVLALGKVKVMLLAALPQEVIDQAAESGNDVIGKADLMTVAELKEEVRALKRREKNYEAELERSQSQVKRLSQSRARLTEFLQRTEEVRSECMALQLEAELPVNSLRKLFEEVSSESADAPENRLQVEHIWIAANVIAARALDLVTLIKAVEEDLPMRLQGTHILSPEETAQWLLDYRTIENRHAAEAIARQEKRDAAKPRGAGRPRGSVNKPKGD